MQLFGQMEKKEKIDVIIWCTGFKASLNHLKSIDIVERDNFVEVQNGRSIKLPNLWLVGYGDWTGMASATLIGVSRTARATVDEIFTYLQEINTKKFSE